jgi:hypothetical protein
VREKPSISRRARRRGRRLAERLMEDESLRDGLTDAEAKRVLDWGLLQAKRSAANTLDLNEEEAHLQLERESERLRATMRRVSRLMSRLGEDTIREAPEITKMLREMNKDEHLAHNPALADRIEELVKDISEMERDQAFNKLMELVSPDDPEGE